MQPCGELVEEIEHAGIRPLQVLEDEECRPVRGELLDDSAGCDEERLPIGRLGPGPKADERSHVRGNVGRLVHAEQLRDGCEQLLRGFGGRVAVEDVRHLLQMSGKGGVGAAGPIRGRPAAQRPASQLRDQVAELIRETRLSDPGRSQDRDQVRTPLLDDPFPRPSKDLELALPTQHRDGGERPLADRHRGSDCVPDGDRTRLSFRHDRLRRPVLDGRPRAPIGLLTDHDSVHGRARLQTCGRVHHVAGDHRLAAAGAGVERHHRLARVHGDAGPEVQLGVGRIELGESLPNGERGADGALRVVAVRERCAEDGHDRVPDELLHQAAEPLDLDPHALVVPVEDGANVLRVEGLGA